MAKQKDTSRPARLPRTHQDYWLSRLFVPKWTRDGKQVDVPKLAVRIAYKGRRETFTLNTTNKAAASATARDIYVSLNSPTGGWGPTLKHYKPRTERRVESPTVGEFITAARAVATVRPLSFESYASKFRTLVAAITGKEGDTRKNDHVGAIDPKTGKRGLPGAKVWRAEVEAVKLSRITPEAVTRWAVRYITKKGKTPEARRHATSTVNALVRNSASLFAEKITRHLAHLSLPKPHPFENVELPKAEKPRYQSRFSREILYAKAEAELWNAAGPEAAGRRELFTILVLGLFAGLRRSEIDALRWSQFDWERGFVFIEASEHSDVKSANSAAAVRLAPSLLALLKEKHETAKSPFVIESTAAVTAPGADRYYRYRCDCHFKKLAAWLRNNGLKGEQKPLHTQRKEFGSFINEAFGLGAAADALRHGNANLTRDYYARPDQRGSFGPDDLKASARTPAERVMRPA